MLSFSELEFKCSMRVIDALNQLHATHTFPHALKPVVQNFYLLCFEKVDNNPC